MFPMLEPCGPWCCGSSLKELFGWFFVGGSECQLKRKWLQILQFIGSLRFSGTTKIVPGQLHSETAWFVEDKSLLDQERPRDRWPLRFALHEILCKRDPQTLQAVILTCVAWLPCLFCTSQEVLSLPKCPRNTGLFGTRVFFFKATCLDLTIFSFRSRGFADAQAIGPKLWWSFSRRRFAEGTERLKQSFPRARWRFPDLNLSSSFQNCLYFFSLTKKRICFKNIREKHRWSAFFLIFFFKFPCMLVFLEGAQIHSISISNLWGSWLLVQEPHVVVTLVRPGGLGVTRLKL